MELRVKKSIEQMTTDFQQIQDLKLNLHLTETGKEEMLNNYDRNMTTICLLA